ncbi:MAG: hypothetical protein ACLQGV_17445 [Bryobacteraceae bacterium]
MGVYETLKQAILSKNPCVIAKAGEPSRSICPYRLGTSAKGELNVIYYQFDGYTSQAGGLQPDGSTANWRCNHVADIETACLAAGPWHEPTVKPKTRGHCVVYTDVEVDY